MVGEILNGRYEILKSVGFGGMAEVYLAKDVLLDRKIAVKGLRKKFLDNSKAQLEQFKREARSAARLIHPSIVTIYDVCDEGDISYILMEYVEGVSLKAFEEQNGKMDPALAVALTAQLASALDHAHKHNIIHCDIKPQNIVLTESMVPKIVDFGISRIVSNETMAFTASVVGSVHYFSPEQAQGLPVTAQSDIYSLGIVFYEMLTGKVPFDGNNAVSVARKQVEEEAPPLKEYWPDAPDALQRIIDKALAKKLKDRYASAEEFKKDLMEIKNRLYPSKNNEPFLVNTIQLPPIAKNSPVRSAVPVVNKPEAETRTVPKHDKFETLIMSLPHFLTEEVDDSTNEFEGFEKPQSTRKVDAIGQHEEPEKHEEESKAEKASGGAAVAGVAAAGLAGGIAAADMKSEPEQQSLFTDEPDIVDQAKTGPESNAEPADSGYGTVRESVGVKPEFEKKVKPTVVQAANKGEEIRLSPVAAKQNTGRAEPAVAETAAKGSVIKTDEPDPERKDKKPKKKSGILSKILAVLLLLILLAAGGVYYFFGESKPEIIVADVNGKPVAEAQKTLEAQGFKVEIENKVDPNVKPGMVLRTDPVAGIKRKEGATITLTVSGTEKMISVPKVVGLKQEQADKLLSDKNLRIERIEYKWDKNQPEDIILSQTPGENSQLGENGAVHIVINKKEEKNVALPELKGLKLADAKKKLAELKLNAEIKEVDSDKDKDTILGMDPGNGSTVLEGSTVTLQVSNASKKITFPSTPDNIGNTNSKPNSSVTVSPSTGSRYVEFVVPGTGTHAVQIVSNNGSRRKVEVSGTYNGGVRLRTKVDSDVRRVGFYVDHKLVGEKSW